MKYKKKKSDFEGHLDSQMSFLELSAISYDNGFEDEAQRLATTIRVMLHDTDSSTSLLNHLGIKSQICFQSSTSFYTPVNILPYTGMLKPQFLSGEGATYQPKCLTRDDTPNKWLSFDDWWNELVIDDKENLMSRKNVILDISNKDGGAHIDANLNKRYSDLTKFNSLKWEYFDGSKNRPLDNNPVYATVRQITDEVLLSLRWHQALNSFSRENHSLRIQFNYVGEIRYMFKYINDDFSSTFFDDKRVTNTEIRNCYQDDIIFKNGSKANRFVIG